MKSFSNKVAIVTGGSSGIGKEVAKRLVEAGASVVIGGRDDEKLAQAALEIDVSGLKVHVYAGDIAQPETAQALVDAAVNTFGGVDILINNTHFQS
ncbi:SDR family NAD(P)-dependent oxidoreductase [Pseudomonas kulmbachensis]|uniref:SDR family NAD(P)-dependent oxidoreductase n=1 Tax=Pseudomonas kulmbachensis TaxID=3043408 RepID=A0ABW7LWP8_9PSED